MDPTVEDDIPPGAETPVFVLPRRFNVLLHQCSKCRFTSTQIQNVNRHVQKRTCKGAQIVSVTVEATPALSEPIEIAASAATTNGDGNAVNGNHNTTQNINITITREAADADDGMALIRLFTREDVLKSLSVLSVQEIPAALFGYLRGSEADPKNRTVKVKGDRVLENGKSLPVSKFVKKTVGDTVEACMMVDPAATPDPETMRGVKTDLTTEEFDLGKRSRASKYDVLKMYALSSKDFYRLGTTARDFVDKTVRNVERELRFLD